MKKHGHKRWAFAAGHIPLTSTGREPAFTSHDKIAVLNTGKKDAEVEIKIFYEDQKPMLHNRITVRGRSVRKIRFNDLIDPFPVPLDTPFGFIVESNRKVIVQFSRMITAAPEVAGFCTTAYCVK